MFDRVLVTTDGSELSNEALQVAVELARPMGSLLLVLHVIPDLFYPNTKPSITNTEKVVHHEQSRDSDGILSDAMQGLGYSHAKPLKFEAHNERVADVITRVAHEENVDLIVMGTHGRQGFDKVLLGSVAERVAHLARPPVMLVRAGQRAHQQEKRAQASQVK
jgi:nucleotide-binding universal stress UspA family protein